jgi:sulfonate transport system permease protein
MRRLRPYTIGILLFLIWTIGSSEGYFNSFLVPSPWQVFKTTQKLMADGTLIQHAGRSLYRVIVGFAITFALAFPLGVMVGLNRTMRAYFEAPLNVVRHIPPLATTPLLILWFGIGEAAKLVIIIMATFFPIFLNTVSGVENCDPKLIEVGKVSGYRPFERMFRIILPYALPSIMVGLRLGLGYSWRALVGAELLAAASGLGYMIIEAEQLSRPDIVIVGILTIGFMGLIIDILFEWFSRLVIPWHQKENTYVQG